MKLDLKEMLTAGLHFGHLKRNWHPKMSPYIHSVRNGRCIIDLIETQAGLEQALEAIQLAASKNHKILFVGTKPQVRIIVQEAAQTVDMPYVTYRWVGGMLTNFNTISVQIKKLAKLEKQLASGELASRYSKLEVQNYQKQIDNLNQLYGGLKDMASRPDMVFISDMKINEIAVSEAHKLGIPIVAIADTNVDPSMADYVIPANDDALTSLQFIVDSIIQAIKAGRQQAPAKVAPSE